MFVNKAGFYQTRYSFDNNLSVYGKRYGNVVILRASEKINQFQHFPRYACFD
jgi:hypothetical protein